MQTALSPIPVHEVTSADEDLGAMYRRFKQSGDRTALEELIGRLQGPAFRVSRLVCGSDALAEEAAQEAFLAVLSPKVEPPPDGEGFRGWFMKVVVNRARMARRTEHRAVRKKQIPRENMAARLGRDEGEAAGCGERAAQCQGVLRCLDELDERWQTPLALYFMEGLPQRDVAKALGVSQQCASDRIKKGLDLLRVRLAQAGLAAVAPASAEVLAEVLRESVKVPTAWAARLKAQAASGELARLAAGAAEHSQRMAVAGSFHVVRWLIGGAVLLLTAASGVWFWTAHTQTEALAERPAESEAPASAAQPTLREVGSWTTLRFTFENGPDPRLKQLIGDWHAQTLNGKPCMGAPPRQGTGVLVDLPMPDGEVLKVSLLPSDFVDVKESQSVSVRWSDGKTILPSNCWYRNLTLGVPRKLPPNEVYALGRWVMNTRNGKLNSIHEYTGDFPRMHFFLVLKNVVLSEIRIERIDLQDVPETFRNPQGLLEAEQDRLIRADQERCALPCDSLNKTWSE